MPEPAAPAPPPAAPTPAPSAAREPDAGSAVEACLEGQVQPRPDLAPPAPPPTAAREPDAGSAVEACLEGQVPPRPDLAPPAPPPTAAREPDAGSAVEACLEGQVQPRPDLAPPAPPPTAARDPDADSAAPLGPCLEGQVPPRPDLAPPAPPRAPPLAPRRQVICGDALTWLEGQGGALAGASLITSLPDLAELHPMPLAEWRAWFIAAAAAVLRACPPDGAAIFYQTDIKHEGAWIDKGYLCQRAAEEVGAALLWHRIVCRAPPGAITFGRPAYAHLLAFAPRPREELAWSTADVLPSGGEMLWSRAIGLDACALACRYVRDHTLTRTIVDPFCGRGTVLAVANHLGLDAVGVDRSPGRCRRAERLVLDPALAPRP